MYAGRTGGVVASSAGGAAAYVGKLKFIGSVAGARAKVGPGETLKLNVAGDEGPTEAYAEVGAACSCVAEGYEVEGKW